MMACRKCGNPISESCEACPFCGATFDENHPALAVIKLIFYLGVLGFAVYGTWKVFAFFGGLFGIE